MNIMQTYEKMFSNEVRLMTLIRNILGLTWNDETMSFVLNGSTMEWTDHEVIDLPNEVELDEDSIDSVLFFGDGTIEYHYKNEQDAFNWGGFSEEVNEKVIEQLKLVWHECCNK
jgi:hypothetical protein